LTERSRALGLLAVALVLSMTTWFSATAVIPQPRADWMLSDSAAAVLENTVGWRYAFAFLAPGLARGGVAMLRLPTSGLSR
jgi:hypothetical protein